MDDFFYNKYKCYEGYPIEKLKHIPEISCYNHNYYIGVKRDNIVIPDLIFTETDECSEVTEYYHIDGDCTTHIGYAYASDEYITLEQETLY